VKVTIPTKGAPPGPLAADELKKINAYWRACNYLSAGMIYLRANPLLREKLKPAHIKLRLLGHWGASPGLSFAYVHLNRLIVKHDLDVIFLTGPGHGAPGVIGPAYLEGSCLSSTPARERPHSPGEAVERECVARDHPPD